MSYQIITPAAAGSLPLYRPSSPVSVSANTSRAPLLLNAVAEAEKLPTKSANGSAVYTDIAKNLKSMFGAQAASNPKDAYHETASSVRKKLMDDFDKPHAHWK
jgi:hypothetical protein